jgi:hypothetical protein
LCFLLALLCKETAFCLPPIFVALLMVVGGRSALRERRWLWGGWTLASCAYLIARSFVIDARLGYVIDRLQTATHRLPVLLADVGKLVLPIRLQVLAAPADVLVWPGLIVCGAMLCAGWRMPESRRNRLWLAASLVFLPLLMSLLGAESVILECRLYLPMVGVSLWLSELLILWRTDEKTGAIATYSACVPLLAGLGVMSFLYAAKFKDRDQFSQAAIEASPNSSIATHLRFRGFYPTIMQGMRNPPRGAIPSK